MFNKSLTGRIRKIFGNPKVSDASNYRVSVEFYNAIKHWNRKHPAAKTPDFLEKLDKYHLSTNLQGAKRIRYVESILNMIGVSMSGTRFLDLGCGMGGALMGAYNMGANYCEGWEINGEKIKFGKINIGQKGQKEKIQIVKRSIDSEFSPEETIDRFQVVICDQVLEHVKNLNESIHTIAHCLDCEKGFAFISSPNGFSVQSVIKDQHLLIFGLTLLDRREGAPLAEAIKGHTHYSEMMGEYKHYNDYVTLFKKNRLRYIPLHTVCLDLKSFFDFKDKLSEIQTLKKELLPNWQDRVPADTLDILSRRLSDYFEEVSARLKETTINLEYNNAFVNLLRDYWLDTYDFLVFHEHNEKISEL